MVRIMPIASGERKTKLRRAPERLASTQMAKNTPASKEVDEARAERLRVRGAHMRDVRIAAGFKRQLHVQRTGAIDSGSLSWLESGDKDINLLVAERLADAYNVSLDVLVGRVPFDPDAVRFPGRAALIGSPEFSAAPKAVQDRVLATTPPEPWSVVRWVRYFTGLCEMFASTGELPKQDEEKRIKPQR